MTNPALDLDVRDKPFFEALDQIARLAEVTTNFGTGDGSIGIMSGAAMQRQAARHAGGQVETAHPV